MAYKYTDIISTPPHTVQRGFTRARSDPVGRVRNQQLQPPQSGRSGWRRHTEPHARRGSEIYCQTSTVHERPARLAAAGCVGAFLRAFVRWVPGTLNEVPQTLSAKRAPKQALFECLF